MRPNDLDERWLPAAAAQARAWAERVAAARLRAAASARSFDLRELDERYARGPLRGLVQHPVVGLVLSGALLVAGIGAAIGQERGSTPTPPAPGQTDTGPSYDSLRGATLGPAVGTDVTAYVRAATDVLDHAATSTPDARRVALVSQTGYLRPEGEARLLDGFRVSRVFVRAPAAGRDATPFPVEVRGDVLSALRAAYANTAKSRADAAASFQAYVSSLRGTTKEDDTFRRLYGAFARAAAIEAKQYGGDCACVYAALVEATPSQLRALRRHDGVRAVELAPAGYSTGQVQVQPLQPEVVGTVPRPTPGGRS